MMGGNAGECFERMVGVKSPNWNGWVAGYLSWWKKRAYVFSIGAKALREWSCFCAQPHPKQVELPLNLLSTFISSSTMCTQPSDPFVEPFYSLKKVFTRLLSSIPESADGTSINIARLSSASPTLITPCSTIRATDIAMPVTSKILSNVPAQKWTLIAHQIKFAGDQVQGPGEGVVEHSQQVLPISTGLH